MRLRHTIAMLMTVFAFDIVDAKTVVWSIPARYDELEYLSETMLRCQTEAKWGIVSTSDKMILEPDYDYVSPFTNGYALACIREGNRYRLRAIVDETGNVKQVEEVYYLHPVYPYFSEGKMAVANRTGKYGYIDSHGNMVIKCQFDNAFPFHEGFALKKNGNFVQFIKENYDVGKTHTLGVVFNYGKMTDATFFSDETAAVAYNNKCALINRSGQEIRKIKTEEFLRLKKKINAPLPADELNIQYDDLFNVYTDGIRYGYNEGNTLVIASCLEYAGNVTSRGTAIAAINGRKGLLRMIEGNYAGDVHPKDGNPSVLNVDKNGNAHECQAVLSVPNSVRLSDVRLQVDRGDGIFLELPLSASSGNTFSTTFVPVPGKDADNCTVVLQAMCGDIPVYSMSKTFDLNHPVLLTHSKPRTTAEYANAQDEQTVIAYIYNKSNKKVSVRATLWVKDPSFNTTKTVDIDAHGTVGISYVVKKVLREEKVKAVLSYNGVVAVNDEIVLKPFF